MNILIDSNIVLLKDSLINDFNVITFDGGELSNSLIREANANILFVRSTTNCNKELLDNTEVEFLGTATAGIDNLDLNYLKSRNIKWTNAAGSNSISVAEYVTLAIQIWCMDNNKEINSITLGVVGYGNIGKKVAKIFEKFCKRILVYDPYVKSSNLEKVNICELDYLLENSDIITFHTPLTKVSDYPTYKMLNFDKLSILNDTKLLINTSRGGVIDESALENLDYNTNNLIFDVWENEPNINYGFAQKLFISTPHIAGHSYEGKLRGTLNMLQSLELYIDKTIDKSIIINELDDKNKIKLSETNYIDLYEKLQSNINLKRTDKQFKRTLNDFEYKKFNNTRKEYPKHNETLKEDSFE